MHTVSDINVPSREAEPYYYIFNIVLYYREGESFAVDCTCVEGLRDVVSLGLASLVALIWGDSQVAWARVID
jgi:hypothetical protein